MPARWPDRAWTVLALLWLAAASLPALGGDDHHFDGIERVVAIGDVHGDWNGYIATLRAAGLVDDRERWSGGETHLVQTGDIADRGPDTRRIVEHMQRLTRQARRAGGRVHQLIGNHEAMNVYGDLRYVTDGEFAAWATRSSSRLRQRYLDEVLARMERDDPEAHAALPEDFRERWLAEHPEGWLEHRYAWSPVWNDDAEMWEWLRDARVAVRINDVLFVHGGISPDFCGGALASWTHRAREALPATGPDELGILVDPLGPLWYRGLSGGEPEAAPAAVAAILEHYGIDHIAVGHTPTGGPVWPRYGGRVVQIDTGIGAAYGGRVGYLEAIGDVLYAGYLAGRVRLPEQASEIPDYARAVAELHPEDAQMRERLAALLAEPEPAPEPAPPADTPEAVSSEAPPAAVSCGRPR